MHWFEYRDDEFYAEDVPLEKIASIFGTPTYVYSRATLERHVEKIDGAFADVDHITCYSMKANSNGAILRLCAERGLGADIVSGGELYRALRAGIPNKKIVYSGVGKTVQEIKYALESGILMFNVESESELHVISKIAQEMGLRAPVSLRVNPDVDPKTHPYISTGLKKNKFGIPFEDALRLYETAANMKSIDVIGIDAHIGSQLLDVTPFRDAAERLGEIVEAVKATGTELSIIDIGGGLGINYDRDFPPDPAKWAEMIMPVVKKHGCRLIIEPGRSVIGNACVLLTKVLYIKRNGEKTFIVVDAAMNDLVRPALYGSYHGSLPVIRRNRETITADIVGPICESGDFLAKDREIEMPEEGDLISFMSAGAYAMSMATNYNSRLRGAEVLVSGTEAALIGRRETYDDLTAREEI